VLGLTAPPAIETQPLPSLSPPAPAAAPAASAMPPKTP